ncbi:DUF2584 family protein [Pontibacillus salicampi]|uniref:DUF2584 family protein n=1 Tax=Pontibacillus salicampi TaxID=1449801 RepID=A0ABV6LLR9_9BACI
MSMPLSMEWCIITQGNEQRIESKENTFTLTLKGYQLFPLDEFLDIKRTAQAEQIGTAKITEITWTNQATTLTYELVSLYSVN